MFTRRRYEACFDFLLQLAEKSRAEKIKYPSLHEDVGLILLIRKQFSLFIEERILFIDSVEADSDFIASSRDVLSGTQAPEAYLDTVIHRKCRDIRLALGKHWQECGQWWEAILSSKHPKRFKTLFDFPSQDILLPAYINSVPKDKIREIYRLTGAARSGSRDWLEP